MVHDHTPMLGFNNFCDKMNIFTTKLSMDFWKSPSESYEIKKKSVHAFRGRFGVDSVRSTKVLSCFPVKECFCT